MDFGEDCEEFDIGAHELPEMGRFYEWNQGHAIFSRGRLIGVIHESEIFIQQIFHYPLDDKLIFGTELELTPEEGKQFQAEVALESSFDKIPVPIDIGSIQDGSLIIDNLEVVPMEISINQESFFFDVKNPLTEVIYLRATINFGHGVARSIPVIHQSDQCKYGNLLVEKIKVFVG
jgi:hypothetical protein